MHGVHQLDVPRVDGEAGLFLRLADQAGNRSFALAVPCQEVVVPACERDVGVAQAQEDPAVLPLEVEVNTEDIQPGAAAPGCRRLVVIAKTEQLLTCAVGQERGISARFLGVFSHAGLLGIGGGRSAVRSGTGAGRCGGGDGEGRVACVA